jgi:hypothetical protein
MPAMFKLFRSRPPIIIINEAEHKEPLPVVQKKSLWSKYAGPVYIVTALFHFIVFIIVLRMINGIQQNAEQANATLLRQLSISDSLYRAVNDAHYNDSLAALQRYKIADSISNASFRALSFQLKEMADQNAAWQKSYREMLSSPETNVVK